MREIKFRAWDNTHKMMVTNSFNDHQLSVPMNNQNWRIDMYSSGGEWCDEYTDIVLMQYTGKCDKNGEEIYEGDILEDDGEWYTVVWDDQNASFECIEHKHGNNISLGELANNSFIQGNIYANPKLIK